MRYVRKTSLSSVTGGRLCDDCGRYFFNDRFLVAHKVNELCLNKDGKKLTNQDLQDESNRPRSKSAPTDIEVLATLPDSRIEEMGADSLTQGLIASKRVSNAQLLGVQPE